METPGTTMGEESEAVTMEESTAAQNNAATSRNALQLQEKLHQLRMQLVKAKARLQVNQGAGANNFLDEEDDAEKLKSLTKKRTATFLDFRGIQMAIQVAEANQALTRALNLETDGAIQLESDEEEYIRGLLEEQRELASGLWKSNKEGVEEELKVMAKQAELAELYCSYRSLAEKGLGRRKWGREAWDLQTKKVEQSAREGDYNLNQMRFTIQKFMLSHEKFGLQFDDKTNSEFQALLIRLGSWPEQLREELMREDTAPAAAADLARE